MKPLSMIQAGNNIGLGMCRDDRGGKQGGQI